MLAHVKVLLALIVGLAGCASPSRVPVVARPAFDMPFCTRTLGVAECFTDPSALPDHPANQGDVPVRLVPMSK